MLYLIKPTLWAEHTLLVPPVDWCQGKSLTHENRLMGTISLPLNHHQNNANISGAVDTVFSFISYKWPSWNSYLHYDMSWHRAEAGMASASSYKLTIVTLQSLMTDPDWHLTPNASWQHCAIMLPGKQATSSFLTYMVNKCISLPHCFI